MFICYKYTPLNSKDAKIKIVAHLKFPFNELKRKKSAHLGALIKNYLLDHTLIIAWHRLL